VTALLITIGTGSPRGGSVIRVDSHLSTFVACIKAAHLSLMRGFGRTLVSTTVIGSDGEYKAVLSPVVMVPLRMNT
jgi:hypothetical protein